MHISAWHGPPSDVLGHPVPIQRFAARTDHVVVALQQVVAFPEGCAFSVQVAVRRGSLDASAWRELLESGTGRDPRDTSADTGPEFGVCFPDGSKTTTAGRTVRSRVQPASGPESPLLIESDSQTSSNDQLYTSDRRLWLWPLPPSGPFEFVVEWQHMGIDATSTTLDGSAVLSAAEQAQPYWP
ncbi:hypothetical protein [Streptomyces sp. HUAS TT7]|uniref:hypothetical protein n=1 Tax=Streptomyces sp. HUAS TT7 TaxID=3447507 RepID=UPI003F65D232